LSFELATQTRLRKSHGPNYLLIARQARLKCFRAPAGFSLGTHKNLQPCRLPNLFSCQTSSSPICIGCPPRRVELLPTQCSAPIATFIHRELIHGGCFDAQHRAEFGGADRDRTGGLLVANQALSQLSYSPNRRFQGFMVSKFQRNTLKP
jgi:hypothetical protein